MNHCVITTVSMTLAMRVKRALSANSIEANVIRLPPGYSDGGCAYGVEIDRNAHADARRVLQISDIPFQKIICTDSPRQAHERRRSRK